LVPAGKHEYAWKAKKMQRRAAARAKQMQQRAEARAKKLQIGAGKQA
jgi:hypothetical protein